MPTEFKICIKAATTGFPPRFLSCHGGDDDDTRDEENREVLFSAGDFSVYLSAVRDSYYV